MEQKLFYFRFFVIVCIFLGSFWSIYAAYTNQEAFFRFRKPALISYFFGRKGARLFYFFLGLFFLCFLLALLYAYLSGNHLLLAWLWDIGGPCMSVKCNKI